MCIQDRRCKLHGLLGISANASSPEKCRDCVELRLRTRSSVSLLNKRVASQDLESSTIDIERAQENTFDTKRVRGHLQEEGDSTEERGQGNLDHRGLSKEKGGSQTHPGPRFHDVFDAGTAQTFNPITVCMHLLILNLLYL